MKKLALLQLMLLPIAGMADITSASAGMAQARENVVDEERLAATVWDTVEAGASAFARRLVGFGYAQSQQHAPGSTRSGR